MLRRLHPEQPDSFSFTDANRHWAEAQMTKYPEGRQASAIIPLLWRAQEQEGWLSRPAIEHVADMLGMAHIRALEVATFYFMFQLQPVGKIANIQVCGTTSCMICGAEDLAQVCREKIAPEPHMLSEDGKLSWEEVECLGACANAPMAQIGKDYYEDLSAASLADIIDALRSGDTPKPGSQNGRFASEPIKGLTSLTEYQDDKITHNASVQRAVDLGDTVKRIDGSEVPLITPWRGGVKRSVKAPAKPKGTPKTIPSSSSNEGRKPKTLKKPRASGADDLKLIKGVGPKLEALLNTMGFFHFDQIANWQDQEILWVDQNLEGFKGRASRDAWIDQAKTLASGGDTDFSRKSKKQGI